MNEAQKLQNKHSRNRNNRAAASDRHSLTTAGKAMPGKTARGGILRENSRFVYIGEMHTQRKTVRYNRLCESQFSTRKAASGRRQPHSTLPLRSSATDERDRRRAISPTLWRWDLQDNYFGKWRHCRKPVIEPRRIPPQQLQRQRKKPHRTP